jgi:hypothetical protein
MRCRNSPGVASRDLGAESRDVVCDDHRVNRGLLF